MSSKIKNIIMVVLGAVLIFGGCIFCLLMPKQEYSESERRPLEKFPQFSTETLISGDFMAGFEKYATDNFPLRDAFRAIKARITYSLFEQKDNNGIYLHQGQIASMDYPYNPESVDYAASRFEYLYQKYLQNSKVYFSVIPDKSSLLAEEAGVLGYDPEQLIGDLKEKMPYGQYIDLLPLLTPQDYYQTDSHWRQECIVDVADRLAAGMGATIPQDGYTTHTADTPFYGVYYGQAAVGGKGDSISYLTNETIDGLTAYDHQNQKAIPIYDTARLTDRDPYELYLSGPLSLATVENPANKNGKHLVVFRDSFGSSVAPLLAQGYEKVTLVDIRYIGIDYVSTLVDYQNADVLFLYSTSVLNNSNTIK
ncbi:MAG: hypothetical protein IKK30_03400 [Clostridia bacterium]|nr:hypothetical protein [Clostridia bacterium]